MSRKDVFQWLALALLLYAGVLHAQVPKVWSDAGVRALEVPLAVPAYSPVHISEEAYYGLPVRTIYKSYPVYHPDREPEGYQEWLARQEPIPAFEASALRTPADWERAGQIVFEAPLSFGPVFFSAENLRDRKFFVETGMPVAKDGTVPFARWVVRSKGKVELGSMGCATCHTRVMADGTVVPGAQGNNPGDRQGAAMLRAGAKFTGPEKMLERVRQFARQFEAPWVSNDPNRRTREMSLEEFIRAGEEIPPGVTARSHTSMLLPPQIPDLIGVQERRYLDHTGLVQQRSIADLMRYSALVQDTIGLARYGDQPSAQKAGQRFSDEQLYALARYLYSLKPPPNPHKFDAEAAAGQKIFSRERCSTCHTPPLYTNNKLIAADGFDPPAELRKRFDVMEERVGTDPRFALQTRKGTGFYKVPSLKGIWYRSPLEHHGSVATLEDWFNPARLGSEYVPSGFRGPDGAKRGVAGHPYGLELSDADRKALIAFLRTL